MRSRIINLLRSRVLAIFLSVALICSMGLGCLPHVSAAEITETTTVQSLDEDSVVELLREAAAIASQDGDECDAAYFEARAESISSDAGIETYGIKSAALKLALRKIASTLRSAPEAIISLAGNFLDSAAKKALRNNVGAIADALESVANIPNIAENFVREAVYNALKGIVGSGTAEVIAAAIEGILKIIA